MAGRKRIHAALAVIERRGRVLICRRRAGDFLGGYWEFPGGKRHPRETWEACVRRELREELGVTPGRPRAWLRLSHRYADRTITFQVFRCTVRGRPRPLEADTLRWVPTARLGRYRFPPANRSLIRRLVSVGVT